MLLWLVCVVVDLIDNLIPAYVISDIGHIENRRSEYYSTE